MTTTEQVVPNPTGKGGFGMIDVIRKRYAKYANNNELPDNWADLTPPVE